MKLSSHIGLVWSRAFLALCGLASLFVSDSVGPRFLPLPAATVVDATSVVNTDAAALGNLNFKKQLNAHVMMAGGSHYSSRDCSNQDPHATQAFLVFVDMPTNRIRPATNCLSFRPNTSQRSTPPGRAPPVHV